MIELRFYNQKDFQHLNYDLDEIQSLYTATVKFALERIEERTEKLGFPITIVFENKPVGFFVLDFGKDKFELSQNPNSVLVRSLSINPNFQGNGIGKSAMAQIPEFLKQNFPETEEIVLAVNQNNESAYQLYLKAGYIFDGKTREGRSGLQYLMSLKF